MKRTDQNTEFLLNVPLLIGTVITGALVAIAGHFWHSWQFENLADGLKSRATRLLEDKKFAEAARYLSQYIQLCPQQVEGYEQLATALVQAATDTAARARAISPLRRAV